MERHRSEQGSRCSSGGVHTDARRASPPTLPRRPSSGVDDAAPPSRPESAQSRNGTRPTPTLSTTRTSSGGKYGRDLPRCLSNRSPGGRLLEGVGVQHPARERTPHVSTWCWRGCPSLAIEPAILNLGPLGAQTNCLWTSSSRLSAVSESALRSSWWRGSPGSSRCWYRPRRMHRWSCTTQL